MREGQWAELALGGSAEATQFNAQPAASLAAGLAASLTALTNF